MKKLLILISIISLIILSSCFTEKKDDGSKTNSGTLKEKEIKTNSGETENTSSGNKEEENTKSGTTEEETKTNSGETENTSSGNKEEENTGSGESLSSKEIEKEVEDLEEDLIGEIETIIKDLDEKAGK